MVTASIEEVENGYVIDIYKHGKKVKQYVARTQEELFNIMKQKIL